MKRILLFVLLSAITVGCRGCGPGAPGEGCNPNNSDSCEEGLVCAPDADDKDICQIPPGAECDPEDEEDYCLEGSVCFPVDDDEDDTSGRCLSERSGSCETSDDCAPGLVCAETPEEDDQCYEDVVIRGMVFDAGTEESIEGARVIALDDKASAASNVGISDENGDYELSVPVERDGDGKPIGDIFFTLRASAQDYQTFPGGIRTALPVQTDIAERDGEDGPWVLQNAITDIALIIHPEERRGLPAIAGQVISDVREAGVLVVAQNAGAGYTAVTDLEGDFVIFNVPNGDYEVKGFAQGVSLEPVNVTMEDEEIDDVELVDSEDGVTTVTGSINPVEGAPPTSVVLVVESTFNPIFLRGEIPSGLRAPEDGPPSITGAWTIEGVPPGRYAVLAAFENDDAVRDPDQAIAGTDIPFITVPAGGTFEVPGSPKITEALDVISPGANEPEGLDSAPTLRWQDDSSEKFYEVRVYDAYGDEVWNNLMVPSVSGGDDVSIQYGGPFEEGMYYQFRATSYREPGGGPTPISTTEDLRGVFYKN